MKNKNKTKAIVIGIVCPILLIMTVLGWGALCEALITGEVYRIIVFITGALVAISATQSLFNVLKDK